MKPQYKWVSKIIIFLLAVLMTLNIRVRFELHPNIFVYNFTLLKLIVFYVNYLWLYPLLLKKRKYIRWAIAALLLIFGTTLLRYTTEEVLARAFLGIHNYGEGTTISYYIEDNFLWLSPYVVLSTLIRFGQTALTHERHRAALEQATTDAELAFLKSQINPHFLFNTLNSIYSLAYQKSDQAPQAILKLSEIMRYMLYDSEDKKVPLHKEIQYLHSFISLQKVRFKDTIFVDLLEEGNTAGLYIEPLLLIAFVENAFKHGVLQDPADPVLIQIIVEQRTLQLYVQNKINQEQKDETGGIGMPNIQRRLALLYPDKHTLSTTQKDSHYICELTLQLD